MQFSTLTIAALLAAFTNAAPAPTTPNKSLNLLHSRSPSLCGPSSYSNRVLSKALGPMTTDCTQMAANIYGGDGVWSIPIDPDPLDFYTLTGVQYGTCAFGVSVTGGVAGVAQIGTQDVVDIVKGAVEQLENTGGTLSAEGFVPCGPDGTPVMTVHWVLYRP